MWHHYTEPHGYRDPLDDGPKKWKPHRPAPSQVQNYWGHIPSVVNRVKSLTPSQSPASPIPKHQSRTPIASVVKGNIADLAPSQSPTSSSQKASNVDRSTITESEKYIARRLLLDLDTNELYLACSDPSGVKFQALSAPLIKRLTEFIACEPINLEHVLSPLRTTLKITIPKE